jgi:hypothetical protein
MPIGGGRVTVDVVGCSSFFSFSEYGVVDGVVDEECGIVLCLYYLV